MSSRTLTATVINFQHRLHIFLSLQHVRIESSVSSTSLPSASVGRKKVDEGGRTVCHVDIKDELARQGTESRLHQRLAVLGLCVAR